MSKLSSDAAKDLPAEAEHVERIRAERSHEREADKLRCEVLKYKQLAKMAEREADDIREASEILSSIRKPNPRIYTPATYRPSGPATAVLPMNDWHSEEEVRPSTINGLNKQNLQIADARIKAVFESAVMLIENERGLSKISELVLPLLGDFMSGHIHPDLVESTLLTPTEVVPWLIDRICGGIDFLLKYSGCKQIIIPTCNGNHGRTTARPRIATAGKHSMEWMMYEVIAKFYKNQPRVKWKIEEGYHNLLDIQGKLVRFHHGDWIKYQGGVLGLAVPVEKARAKWNDSLRADYDIFGHWHTHLLGERWCSCGCLIGYNAYAQFIKAACKPPSQTLLIFDKKRPFPVVVREVFCD